MTKRLTVDMVLKAYEETGMKPATGTFYDVLSDKSSCGCGFGAYAEQQKIDPWEDDELDSLGFTERYRTGFYNGFDGEKEESVRTWIEENKDFALGYEDGKATHRAVEEKYEKVYEM